MKTRIAVIVAVLAILTGLYMAFFASSDRSAGEGYPRSGDIQNLKIN